MTIRRMKLKDLHLCKPLQPRGGELDRETVKEYAGAVKAGAKFPPLLAFEVTDRKFKGPALVAGFHRHAAYEQAGVDEAEVEVREGTYQDAWLAGWLSNLTNGLRYTNEQKRNAVDTALMLFRDKSARALAEMLHVSQTFVADRRQSLIDLKKIDAPKEVVGKDGVSQKSVKPKSDPGVNGLHRDEIDKQSSDPKRQKIEAAISEDPEKTDEQVAFFVGCDAERVAEVRESIADEAPESDPDADPSEAFCETLAGMCREIDDLVRRVNDLKDSPYGRFVHYQSAVASLRGARETLWGGRPTHECPYCKVAGEPQPNCRCCKGLGVTTKSSYKAGVAAVGGSAR